MLDRVFEQQLFPEIVLGASLYRALEVSLAKVPYLVIFLVAATLEALGAELTLEWVLVGVLAMMHVKVTDLGKSFSTNASINFTQLSGAYVHLRRYRRKLCRTNEVSR
jgi:hypothetical protein